MMMPSGSSDVSPAPREMPKSLSLAKPTRGPRSATRMLPGLMSRCTMPTACAAASASATWAPIWATSSTGSVSTRPSARATLREGRCSITSQGSPASSTTS
ncbi:Uncharacterised protein [Mycobacteroides abscessus subsp. abscessus]|nr:Uncharacterised protein [Mycobacteroides abscessus subsp. abscessus]